MDGNVSDDSMLRRTELYVLQMCMCAVYEYIGRCSLSQRISVWMQLSFEYRRLHHQKRILAFQDIAMRCSER